jgi:branched-chain amino acid transport system permease protein
VLFPIGLSQTLHAISGNNIDSAVLENIQKLVFGGLIIWFLIKEPEGLAKLWQRFYHWTQRLRRRASDSF